MTNGSASWDEQYDESRISINSLTVEDISTGDATGNDNVESSFQFGIDPPSEKFAVNTTVSGLPEDPENYQNLGIQIGEGDQEDYVKLVAGNGQPEIEFSQEVDSTLSPNRMADSELAGPDTEIGLSIVVDPSTNEAVAYYRIDGGSWTQVTSGGSPVVYDVEDLLDTSDGQGLAVGIISTSIDSDPFDGTWHDLSVETVETQEEAHSADISVLEGNQDKDTSPWLFTDPVSIENTGDVPITGVTLDASTAALPDLQAAGMKDGYSGSTSGQTMTIDFSGDPIAAGETASGNIDYNHDTQSETGAGGGPYHQAYEISGLEMAGTTVTVEYEDGTTQTTELASDGSPAGAVGVADDDVPSAPTLGVDGVSTDGSALGAPHEAAVVNSEEHLIHITEGPANGNVALYRIEGEMNVTGPDGSFSFSDFSSVQDYEANRFYLDKTEHDVELDAGGHGHATVSLTNNTESPPDEGGMNYILAVVEDEDGDYGLMSNVVVLEYQEEQEPPENDFDGDGTPNAQDTDDDGDGIPDVNDPFALDADNGLSTSVPHNLTLEPNSQPGT
ncbi:hypothetical protein GJ633_16425, partial [Halorubrum sp. CBA1125]|uniref:hypothetical protein n=1 Tax=Halorubrum sp. CBA1125 TaxID=2668072 RepID=UPI0012E8B27E